MAREVETMKTIPNNTAVTEIKIHSMVTPLCSVGKLPFLADIEMIYAPKDRLIEFESYETWLNEFNSRSLTIEDLASEIARKVHDETDALVEVRVKARTTVHGDTEVVCRL
jgi:NADPH-dependent 7-cyano-7-deazaguanine reductase QueF